MSSHGTIPALTNRASPCGRTKEAVPGSGSTPDQDRSARASGSVYSVRRWSGRPEASRDEAASRGVVTCSMRRGATGMPVSASWAFMASGMDRPAMSSRRSRVRRAGRAREVGGSYVAALRPLPERGTYRISVTSGGARWNSRTTNFPVAPHADIARPGGGIPADRSRRRRALGNSQFFVYGGRVNSGRPEC